MKNRKHQIYEEYWSYTAAWTDINGKKFNKCLEICVDFIEKNNITIFNKEQYEQLNNLVKNEFGFKGKDADLSARKGINQMVKIGFLKPYLSGYRQEAKEYLDAKTNIRRTNIISKVVYKYSNFQNSITDPDYRSASQIQFLLKTLEEVGQLDKRALIALMTVDINNWPRGYLYKQELDILYKEATDIDFIDRKYNQLDHFLNLLGRLDDLYVKDGIIYFKTDAERLFGSSKEEDKKAIRDPYLQRVYKSELEEESCIHYKCSTPKCMIEGLSHPVLIASHIKPYSHCLNKEDERFDVNNGLLLCKSFDSLFDLGYITFSPEGTIIPSVVLDEDLKNYLSGFRLHPDFINPQRMEYMNYHKNFVFNKRFSTKNVRKYIFEEDNYLRAAEEEPII